VVWSIRDGNNPIGLSLFALENKNKWPENWLAENPITHQSVQSVESFAHVGGPHRQIYLRRRSQSELPYGGHIHLISVLHVGPHGGLSVDGHTESFLLPGSPRTSSAAFAPRDCSSLQSRPAADRALPAATPSRSPRARTTTPPAPVIAIAHNAFVACRQADCHSVNRRSFCIAQRPGPPRGASYSAP
jgi:hypothetical protein